MKTIELTRGLSAIVDDQDYEFLSQWKWHANKGKHTWYALREAREAGGKVVISMHRLIAQPQEGEQVDHKDLNGLNNTRSNLRCCQPSQQGMNKIKRRVSCSSKYKGVSLQAKKRGRKCWRATIRAQGKDIHLGWFDNETSAARAYDSAADRYFGEFARKNFPETEAADIWLMAQGEREPELVGVH